MDESVMDPDGTPADRMSPARRVAIVVVIMLAAALQLLVGWFTAVSGLIAPLWAVVLLGVVWVVAVVLLVRTARTSPLLTPLVPIGNALIWWATITAGDVWLGWTA